MVVLMVDNERIYARGLRYSERIACKKTDRLPV